MSFGRHSWRRVHTKRPAKAFGFGLLGVGAIGLIPVDRRTSRNAGQNFAFPIMKKVPHATEESGTFVGGVASHLNHPLSGGMSGQTGKNWRGEIPAGGETPSGEHLDGEEVESCKDGDVRGDEISPGGILTPLGCRLDAAPAKDC